MYLLKEILVRANKDWEVITNDIMLGELLKRYNTILVTVRIPNTEEFTQHNLINFKQVYSTNAATLLSNFLLNYTEPLPAAINPIKDILHKKKIVFNSLWEFGLDADRGIFDDGVIVENYNNLPDIVISKPDNYPNTLESLHNKILYLVNGIVFFEQFRDNKAYLVNGSYALDRYKNEQLAVIDFSQLGGFQPIFLDNTNTVLFKKTNEQFIFHITLPGSLKYFTPILVINGRLYTNSNLCTVLSEFKIAIRVKFSTIYKETLGIPAKELSWVTEASLNGDGINIDTIDPMLYIAQGNSSVLLLNTKELNVHKVELNRSGFVDQYTSSVVTDGIMYLEDGTIGSYYISTITQYGIVYSVSSPKLLHALFESSPDANETGINLANTALVSETSSATVYELFTL
jgi:hypothetical protein